MPIDQAPPDERRKDHHQPQGFVHSHSLIRLLENRWGKIFRRMGVTYHRLGTELRLQFLWKSAWDSRPENYDHWPTFRDAEATQCIQLSNFSCSPTLSGISKCVWGHTRLDQSRANCIDTNISLLELVCRSLCHRVDAIALWAQTR